MYVSWYDSPLGKLLMTCTDQGLTGIYMNREVSRKDVHPFFQMAEKWLDSYFRGENPTVTVPLSLEGTSFQQMVWKLLLTIPYGETRSYGSIAKEIAAQLGKEKMSAQAVGQAVGRNGNLTGYAGGMENKIWLLEHESRQRIGETDNALCRI